MRIAIDASQIIYGTGVSVYTRNLIENILLYDKENQYLIFGGSLRRIGELKTILSKFKAINFSFKVFPFPPALADIIWNRLHFFRIENLIGKIDVFHSSDWTQPPSNSFKVTTVHDVVPVKYPALSSAKLINNQKLRLEWVRKEVDRIIVPSFSTALDLEDIGFKREKIRVIPEALDSSFKPVKKREIEKVKQRLRIRGKYLLSVGVNERKNTRRIIEALEKIRAETDIQLVIVGNSFVNLPQTPGVIFTGFVSYDILPSLYSGAEALVYPSLYEGFGLPILEAFSCKTPVVTSNLGSMAEVAGRAAVLVDPYDVYSIYEGIRKAILNRSKLIKLGLKRLKNYSWERTAKETLKVYLESS